jgi:hypothetical protein
MERTNVVFERARDVSMLDLENRSFSSFRCLEVEFLVHRVRTDVDLRSLLLQS